MESHCCSAFFTYLHCHLIWHGFPLFYVVCRLFWKQATKVGKDSSIQRMIQLVQSADAGKTKIVGIADRWATWIVVIALSAATFTCIISGELICAVTILVVFCPCALVLATPTAIMAAIGNATKHGFLVRASIGKSSSKLLAKSPVRKSAGRQNV